MQCNIPYDPNPFLQNWLLSGHCAAVVREAATVLGGIFSGIVAEDTGALKASPRVDTMLGGEKHDRICAVLTVGENLPRGGYAAAHNFGIGNHPRSRKPPTNWMPQAPANDLGKAMAILDAISR